jgi:hypothetical protein
MGSIGIYLNPRRLQAFRASTIHAAPGDQDWVLISEDSMIGMAQVREIARERKLLDNVEAIQWTGRTDTAPDERDETGEPSNAS